MRSLLPLSALLIVAALGPSSPAAAQAGDPVWIHAAPLVGAVAASVPGEAPRPAAALQLEISRRLPMGLGVTAGYAWPSAAAQDDELRGPWGEATYAYRFRLRFRGHLSPYAGPVLGGSLHQRGEPEGAADEEGWLFRWHFGGRAGIDIPVGGGWPAVRVEVAYRHAPSAGGFGGSDTATALVGFRWSRPLQTQTID